MHTHKYLGTTSYDQCHDHYYKGLTSYDPDVPGHIHRMEGCTSVSDCHSHRYCLATGPAVYLPDGRHYHCYCGATTVDFQHNHQLNACTWLHSIHHCCPIM